MMIIVAAQIWDSEAEIIMMIEKEDGEVEGLMTVSTFGIFYILK